MKKFEELKNKLYEKIDKEMSDYKEELKQMTPDKIIENAYRLVVKDEIACELKGMYLDEEEIKAMLKQEDLLSTFYDDWLNCDGRLGEVISDTTMTETVETILEDYNDERRKKVRESRW